MTNSAVELAPFDSVIGQWVNAEFKKVEQSLKVVLRQAIQDGELSLNAQPDNLAAYLLGVAQGIMVLGRCRASRRQSKSLTDTALGAFEEHQTSDLRIASKDRKIDFEYEK